MATCRRRRQLRHQHQRDRLGPRYQHLEQPSKYGTGPRLPRRRDGGPTSFYAVAGNSAPGTPTNDNQQYTETCTYTDTDADHNIHAYSDGYGNTDSDC